MDPKPVGSYPPTGIDVLIVGSGISGLTAGIECVRKGHNVRILERSEAVNMTGDMFFIGISCTKFMVHWPTLAKSYDDITAHEAWLQTLKHSGESMIEPLKISDRLKRSGANITKPPATLQMRPLLYSILARQAEDLGIEVQYGTKVTSFTEDKDKAKAFCKTEDGEVFEADIIIAADGIGSKSQDITGGQGRARKSGRAIWRAAFPSSHLQKDENVKRFFRTMAGSEPILRAWLAPGGYALTLNRPETVVWVMNHDATGSEKESWHDTIEAEEVLSMMDRGVGPEPWAPILKSLIRLTPSNTIVNWELLWRDPETSWASPESRIVQIGDAAHSFMPASGNGATMAMEDAITIAECLYQAGSSRIAEAVQSFVRMRFTRAACAQKVGFSSAVLLQDTDWDKAKLDVRFAQPKYPRWVWDHDPEAYARENYNKVIENVRQGARLEDLEEYGVEPNWPKGYRYIPWTVEDIMHSIHETGQVQLGDGEWD